LISGLRAVARLAGAAPGVSSIASLFASHLKSHDTLRNF
jgi:hypothetical protein